MREIGKYLEDYTRQLGLEWEIEFEQGRMFAMMSAPAGRKHLIQYTNANSGDLKKFNPGNPVLGMFIHELCHAHLGEKIDPLFAGSTVAACSAERRHEMADFDQSVVNIWVNDVFYKNWPKLFRSHANNFANRCVISARAGLWGT